MRARWGEGTTRLGARRLCEARDSRRMYEARGPVDVRGGRPLLAVRGAEHPIIVRSRLPREAPAPRPPYAAASCQLPAASRQPPAARSPDPSASPHAAPAQPPHAPSHPPPPRTVARDIPLLPLRRQHSVMHRRPISLLQRRRSHRRWPQHNRDHSPQYRPGATPPPLRLLVHVPRPPCRLVSCTTLGTGNGSKLKPA